MPARTLVSALVTLLSLALAPSASAIVYGSNTVINIPGSGTANPYPDSISTSFDPEARFAITRARVELCGYHHAEPRDVDVLLVGPRGHRILLMSDVGGTDSISSGSKRRYIFSDSAAAPLATPSGPASSPSGTYKPSNNGTTTDVFQPPAPAAPFASTLSVLNGTDPSGTWRLFVRDDNNTNTGTGQITCGFALHLDLTDATPDEPDPIDCEPGEPGCDDEGGETPTVTGGSVSFSALTAAEGFQVKVKVKKSGSTVKGKLVKAKKKKKKRARRSVGAAVTNAAASAKKKTKKAFVYARGKAKKVPKGTYRLLLKPTKKGAARLRKALERRRSVKLVARLTVDPPGKGKVARKSVKLKITR